MFDLNGMPEANTLQVPERRKHRGGVNCLLRGMSTRMKNVLTNFVFEE